MDFVQSGLIPNAIKQKMWIFLHFKFLIFSATAQSFITVISFIILEHYIPH